MLLKTGEMMEDPIGRYNCGGKNNMLYGIEGPGQCFAGPYAS
jgi:hypothetical protein